MKDDNDAPLPIESLGTGVVTTQHAGREGGAVGRPATRMHADLGAELDLPPTAPVDLNQYDESRLVLRRAERAETEGDLQYFLELKWELAALRLTLPGTDQESAVATLYSPDSYALGEGAGDYLARRVEETLHPGLRVRYAELRLLIGPQRGREMLENTRSVARAYRQLVEFVTERLTPGEEGFAGLTIGQAIRRGTRVARRAGVLSPAEQCEWIEWVVGVGQFLAEFEWDEERNGGLGKEFWRHRYSFEVLETLTLLSPERIGPKQRADALRLVGAAYAHFAEDPKSEHFAITLARIEGALRKHFGEADTHRTVVRRQFDALLRRAAADDGQGQHLVEAHFVRGALELAMKYRDLFSEEEVSALRQRERAAIEGAIAAGEFKTISHSAEVDPENYTIMAETPEQTVNLLVEAAPGLLPDPDELLTQAKAEAAGSISSLVSKTSMRGSKVVSQGRTDEERHQEGAWWRMTLHAQNDVRLYIHVSLRRAHEEQGLMPKHLVEVLRELAIDDGTAELLERGYERYFAMDGISACHVLVPRVEDILRHELRRLGVEATQYQPGDDATSSRTDDVTFGTLLYRNAADGRSVRDILGGPLFEYLRALFIEPVSLNLRNEFAHGLARPQDCNAATVAIVTHVLLCLVALRRSGGDHEGKHGEATSTVPPSPALPKEPR